ncbi:MAG: hypothetical protein ABJA78_03855 [Ferruginibacter sp.]
MKNFLLLGLFVLMLVISQFAQAQTVDEVITKYENARGGKDKLNAVKSIYMEGSRQMMGNEITVRITKEQNKLSRTEFDMGSGTGYFLLTDKGGWSLIPMRSPDPTKMPDASLPALQSELDIAGPLVDYAAKGNKAELQGKEKINDADCFKIKLTTKAGTEIIYWIDVASNLLVQSSQKSQGGRGGAEVEVKTTYKDYKDVDGIKFAHTIDVTGGFGGSTTFDKMELNKAVDPKLYKP